MSGIENTRRNGGHLANTRPSERLRILNPDRHHFFIGQIASVLEQLQPDHQANGVARAANAGFVQAAKALLARFPIDLLGQLNQRMAQVYEVDQFLAEQVAFCRLSRLAQGHEFARFGAFIAPILAISVPSHHPVNPYQY